jgi:hypothetical protein
MISFRNNTNVFCKVLPVGYHIHFAGDKSKAVLRVSVAKEDKQNTIPIIKNNIFFIIIYFVIGVTISHTFSFRMLTGPNKPASVSGVLALNISKRKTS